MPNLLNHTKLTCILFLVLIYNTSTAQQSQGCVFIQGDYIEIGIAPNGAFGTPADAPAGYHARPLPLFNSLYNPVTSTYSNRYNAVGFVADYGKDGWTVGTPAYFGDYFMPGAVQEGFSLQANGLRGNAWSNNYQTNGSSGFSGTLTGSNVSLTVTPTDKKAVWEGVMNQLFVRQTITVKQNKSYFTANLVLKNLSTDTIRKIYYMRTVDPDNEVSVSGSFTTKNKIAYQLPNAGNKTLVTATGTTYTNSYLGLGTKDCQARCFFLSSGLFPNGDMETIYTGLAGYNYVDSLTMDVGIGLVFKIGNLPPGDSTTFSYAYILNESDLDEAFDATDPGFRYNGTFYPSGSIIIQPVGTVLPIDIVNGDYYNWTWTPSTHLDVTTGTHVNDTVGTAPVTYTVTGVGSGSISTLCNNRSISITVSPFAVSPPPAVNSPVTYCLNQTPSALSASGPGIIRWYTTATGGTGSTTAPIPSTAVAVTTTWYVTQEISGVESVRLPVVVIVRPLPTLLVSPANPVICIGDTIRLIASGSTAAHTWAPSDQLSSSTGDTVRAYPLTTTLYTVTATDQFTCKSTVTVNLLVNPLPNVLVNPSPGILCRADSLQLTATGSSVAYTWTPVSGINTTSGAVVIVKPLSTTTYFVTGTDVNNCIKTVPVPVTVKPLPTPSLGRDRSICAGTTAMLYPGIYNNYLWQDNATQSSYPVSDIGMYWVKVTDASGCKAADTINILSLFPLPNNFLPNDTSICRGSTMIISVPGYPQYLWGDGSIKSTIILKTVGSYKLTVKDKNGCVGSDSIQLFDARCIPFAIPNAFTPNRDGKNDQFRPFITQVVTGYKMTIWNRWGEKIFESEIPKQGWDGTYKGQQQAAGTYVYQIQFIDFDGVPVNVKGTLNLIQ